MYIGAKYYGLPASIMDFKKFDGLTVVGGIPYGFVCFEQNVLVLWDMTAFVKSHTNKAR